MSRHKGRVGMVCLAWALVGPMVVSGARAQIATVSAQPVKKWFADVREIGSKVLPPELFQQFSGGLDRMAAPGAIKGLDDSRSFGAFADISAKGEPPLVAILIPVTDAKVFIETAKGFGLDVEDAPTGSAHSHQLTLPDGRTKLFAFPMQKNLFLTLFPVRPARLQVLKPAELESIRPKSSALTTSVRLDKVPAQVRQQFEQGFEKSIADKQERQPGEEESHFLGRKLGQDVTAEAVRSLVREGREVAVDFSVNPKAGPISIEVRVAAKPGSPLAATFKSFGGRRSLFEGIGSNAAMSLWASLPVPEAFQKLRPKLIADLKKATDQGKDEAQKKLNKEVFTLIEPTLMSDAVDVGVATLGPYPSKNPKHPTNVALICFKVKNGAAMEKALRGRAKEAGIKLDAAKSKDGKVSIHQALKPEPKADPFLGRAIPSVAIKDDVVLFALGEKGVDAIQAALQKMSQPPAAKSQMEVSLALKKVMLLAPDEAQRDAAEAVSRTVFAGADAGKDSLKLSLRGEGDGLRLKLDADVVLLKFLVNMGMTMQNAGQP